MKKTQKLFIVLALCVVIFFLSCGTARNTPESVIAHFFELYNKEEFNEAHYSCPNIDIEDIKQLSDSLGKIEEFVLYNSETFNENDPLETKKLYYKCKFENKKNNIYFVFTISNQENHYEIELFYQNENKEFINNLEENYKNALQTCDDYYKFIADDETDKIATLLDDKLIFPDMIEYFIVFIEGRWENYGKTESYTLYSSKIITKNGEPAYIFVFKCETDGMYQTMYEEISVIHRDDIYKIYDDKYANSISELETVE